MRYGFGVFETFGKCATIINTIRYWRDVKNLYIVIPFFILRSNTM